MANICVCKHWTHWKSDMEINAEINFSLSYYFEISLHWNEVDILIDLTQEMYDNIVKSVLEFLKPRHM